MQADNVILRYIALTASSYGFDSHESNGILFVNTSESHLMSLQFKAIDSESALMIGAVETVGTHVHGDRTGFAHTIATIWGLVLRIDCLCSVLIISSEGYTPGEYPDNYIRFSQPDKTTITNSSADRELLKLLFRSTFQAALCVDTIMEANRIEPSKLFTKEQSANDNKARWASIDKWATGIAESAGSNLHSPDTVNYGHTYGSNILHYLDVDAGFKVLSFSNSLYRMFRNYEKNSKAQIIKGVLSDLYITESIRNQVPEDRLTLAKKLMEGLHKDIPKTGHKAPFVLVPLESEMHLICPHGIITVAGSCGLDGFLEEKERIRDRHQKESKLLFPPTKYVWASKVDDDKFEQLVYELVKREPGVTRARRIGNSRSPDGGRDIQADWLLPPLDSKNNKFSVTKKPEADKSDTPDLLIESRVIVQCKAFSKSVDKSKVTDIRDTVEHYQSQGYLLVAYPSITAPLVDHLDSLRLRGNIWVDWWCKDEIEEKLDYHPDLVILFADVITRIN